MTRLFRLTNQLRLEDKVQFIFDTQGNESKKMLLREYNSFISVSPLWATQLTAGLPTFADEKIYKPLQAADMLAWHARRYYYDLSCGKEPEASGYCWKQGGDSDDIAGPNRCIDNLIPPKKNKSVWANQRSSNPDSESNSI